MLNIIGIIIQKEIAQMVHYFTVDKYFKKMF